MAGRIPAPAVGEVGQGQRLGQHGEVGDSFEAHRGGVAHRTRTLGGGGGSVQECAGARPEKQRVVPVVGLVGTEASWWSLRMGWRHRMRTRSGRRQEALQRKQNSTALEASLALL
jgi:hypothetical protein